MILAIGRLSFKTGMEKKGLDILKENSALGAGQPGCIEATVVQNVNQPSEILLISRWQDEVVYSNAVTNLKRNPIARRLFLKVLPHLKNQPHYESYNIISIT